MSVQNAKSFTQPHIVANMVYRHCRDLETYEGMRLNCKIEKVATDNNTIKIGVVPNEDLWVRLNDQDFGGFWGRSISPFWNSAIRGLDEVGISMGIFFQYFDGKVDEIYLNSEGQISRETREPGKDGVNAREHESWMKNMAFCVVIRSCSDEVVADFKRDNFYLKNFPFVCTNPKGIIMQIPEGEEACVYVDGFRVQGLSDILNGKKLRYQYAFKGTDLNMSADFYCLNGQALVKKITKLFPKVNASEYVEPIEPYMLSQLLPTWEALKSAISNVEGLENEMDWDLVDKMDAAVHALEAEGK